MDQIVRERKRSSADRDHPPLESVDNHIIGLMRLILAASALIIIYIDPSQPDHNVALTYSTLVLYTLYSAALYFLSLRGSSILPARAIHWVDVIWYLLLISFSSGTNSIFFFFFFFPILVASFRWGFKAGLQVTVCSTLLFSVIGYATAPVGQDFELNRSLLRPIYLLVLGYMVAHWGGAEIQLKRRLALLKEASKVSNPRFGIDHTVGSLMKKLRAFYDADTCLLITYDPNADEYRFTQVKDAQPDEDARSEKVPPELARKLLTLPENIAVVYKGKRRVRVLHWAGYYARDLAVDARTSEGREASDVLATTLEADSFISVPLHVKGQMSGRIYLTGRGGIFDDSDIDFLLQLIDQVMPVLDNIRLLDRLASNAAEQERQKIARDIHDSVIQPYIGLQYKVAAIRNKFATGANVGQDLDQLLEVTSSEVTGLRSYVRDLKADGGRQGDLVAAIRRHALKFRENYGITVEIDCKADLNISDRLAAEVFQLIHEALSNVRRHTEATNVKISLESQANNFILRAENEGASGDAATQPFTPRSITERAEALGGQAHVELRKEGRTVIEVSIPL